MTDHLEDNHPDESLIEEKATLIATAPGFRRSYEQYLMATLVDLTQLVHFRPYVVHAIQRILGQKPIDRSLPMTKIVWSALQKVTHQYFAESAKEYGWTTDLTNHQEKSWLELLEPAWVTSRESRRIDITTLRAWRDQFIDARKRESGPYLGCDSCTSKCIYRQEAAALAEDSLHHSQFISSINCDDIHLAPVIASHCSELCKQIGLHKDIDFIYCLANQLLEKLSIPPERRQRLAADIRIALEDPPRENTA